MHPLKPSPRPWGLSALLTGCSLLLAACSSAPLQPQPVPLGDRAAVQQQLRAFIAHELASHPVAGLSIALVEGQDTVWTYGAGWADQAARRGADGQTLYRMGSVSKLFTATAAMQLVAQGRLALDAPIQQALPGLRISTRWPATPITVRQLMTHHSGLPRDRLGGMWGTPVGDFRGIVPALADEPAAAPPGRLFAYSNVGVTLLGVAVESLAGMPFEQHLQQAVLRPLGMDSASFSAAVPETPQMAQAYFQREPRQEPGLRDVPAGGLTASVSDMARFLAMQFAQGRNAQGQVVLPQPQWAETLRVQNDAVALDLGFGVGLGWMFSTLGSDTVHGGGPVAHHAGATYYHRSQLMMLPEHGLGVVVAANDGAAGPVVNRIAQRALALMLEARTGVRQVPAEPGFKPATTPWTDAQRQACVGEYLTLAGLLATRLDGTQLRGQLDEHTLDLLEGQNQALGLRYRLGGLIEVPLGALAHIGLQCRQIDGQAVLVALQDGQHLLAGGRMEPPARPLTPEWLAMAGRYQPQLAPGEQPAVEQVQLEAAGGRLWVRARSVPAFGGAVLRLPLVMLTDDEALIAGPMPDNGPVVRLQRTAGGPPQLRFSGWTWVRTGP